MTTEHAREVCEGMSLCLGELLHLKQARGHEEETEAAEQEKEPYVALVEQAFTTLRDLVIAAHFRFVRETF